MKRDLQPSPPPAQQPHGDADIVGELRDRVRVGEPLPARCLQEDLMRIFQIQRTQFYRLVKAGKFDRFEIRPRIGRRAWSGKLIERYLNGESGSSRFVA